MAAIEILGLEKTYSVGFWRKKPKYALRPLNLTIQEGEIFGFLGPNGAGKTTTLKLLMGLIFPTAGSARILGMEVDDPMSGLDPMGRREVRDLMEQLKLEGKTVFFSTHILSDAEALCDRVAIINQGELQGVGAVADLTSSVHGKVELVWQGPAVPAALRALGAECHVTGETVRAILSEANQDAAIEALRRERLRLVSVTPVRTSLEDYFMQKLQPTVATSGARA